MDWDFVKKLFQIFYKIFLLSVLLIICLTALPKIIDYYRGEKIIVEGEFTIISKNDPHFLWVTGDKAFTLESDTKERYIVYVSDVVFQSYLVNDKIKATFETYSKCDTCSNFKVGGIVVNENE